MIKVTSVGLPDNVIDTALPNEVSLDYSHKLRFEVAKTNVGRG